MAKQKSNGITDYVPFFDITSYAVDVFSHGKIYHAQWKVYRARQVRGKQEPKMFSCQCPTE